MKHVLSLSGGIGSYEALKRMLATIPKEDIIVCFCDVLEENGDLYCFLLDIEKKYEISIVRLCAGKTVFQCQLEDNYIYNSRVANCSKKLKGDPFRAYLSTLEEDYIVYLGIDWTETHRCEGNIRRYAPHEVRFPMCEKPYLTKPEMIATLESVGIEVPELYQKGYSHNNCNGLCVRAGIGQWLHTLITDRSEFLQAENAEQALQRLLHSDKTHLKRYGKPYSLRQLRIDHDSQPKRFTIDDYLDIGGCGCFSGDE